MTPADLPLRDLHLPAPIGWWPMAAGWWWLVGALMLLLAAGAAVILLRRWRRVRLGHWIRPQFAALNRRYEQDQDALALLQSLSILLRRACISVYPRERVAGLTQANWLGLLDQTGDTSQFSQGPGRILAHGPYLRSVDSKEVEQLLPLVRTWIDHCDHEKLRGSGP